MSSQNLTRNSPSNLGKHNLGPLDSAQQQQRPYLYNQNIQQQSSSGQIYDQEQGGCQMSGDLSHNHSHLSQSHNTPECVTRVSIHRQTANENANFSGHESNESTCGLRPSPRIVRWSSVDRLTTPTSDCLQVQPIEIHYGGTRDGLVSVSEENGAHTMTVDGDSLTLVILDCSPQPQHIIQGDSRCNSAAANRACDCLSRCCCQTELIVKQHMIPCHHSPIPTQQPQYLTEITEVDTTITREESNQEIECRRQQQLKNQYNQERDQQSQYSHQPYRQLSDQQYTNYSNSSLPQQQQQSYHNQQQQNFQTDYSRYNQTVGQQPQDQTKQYSYSQQSTSSYQPQYNFQPYSQNQRQLQQQQFDRQRRREIDNSELFYTTSTTDQLDELQFEAEMARKKAEGTRRGPRQKKSLDTKTNQSSQQQQSPEQQLLSPNQQPPQDTQQQEQQQYKGKTRTVKKWDWNQQQFVLIEVPDGPSPKPAQQQAIASTSTSVTPPVPVQAKAQTPTSGPVTPSAPPAEIQYLSQEPPTGPRITTTATTTTTTTTSYSASARPTSSESGDGTAKDGPQYEPSWLAYRVPDMDSVQSDPLYSDLMMELQRLEEGVKPATETVIVEPETFQQPVFGQPITPEHVEINEYETVEFVCRLIPISDPTMRVEWSVNGKPLLESNRYTNEHEFGVARLRIKRCEAEDSGIYQCKAINSLGEAISTCSLRVHAKGNVQYETLNPAGLDKIRQLENPKPVDHAEEQTIEQPPKFLTHITDYVEKDEGESVHFECCLSPVDDPDLKTEWFFNGRPLITGSRFHTIDDFGFIVLDIDWLFPRDTGEYVCRATNKYGTDITRTVLRVKPAKNIILESQLDNPQVIDKLRQLEFPDVEQEVETEEPNRPAHFVQQLRSEGNKSNFIEGDNVHFEARVGPATDGNLVVEWFHNDKPLISGHRFKPSFDFGHIQLDILYVYGEDSGIYKCVAKNVAGTDVSQYEIRVKSKPSLVYQSQLPKEMEGGVQKITEMEAMWNRAPDPEEEEAPAERKPPEFVLKPKPYTAFEGSCARFCCRVMGNPRPRLTWAVNGQTVVSGSRYKLTYDGMYHLTIPKCQLSDAGKVEVYARNLLGECFCTTELKVKRKVDDYRGVLKNSPNPWYDEQSLKVYQRQRSQDLTDDEDFYTFQQSLKLKLPTEQQTHSPLANQVIGYMEPNTPDVNLLAHSPLVAPGDLHPVVVEQQVIMAPAPSTIKRALDVKDDIKQPEKSFELPDPNRERQYQHERQQLEEERLGRELERQKREQERQKHDQERQRHEQERQQQRQGVRDINSSYAQDLSQEQRHNADMQHVFGLDLPRYSAQVADSNQHKAQHLSQRKQHQQQQGQQDQHLEYQERLRQQQQKQQSQHQRKQQYQMQMQQQQQQQVCDPRLPPPSPESVVHGKEVHSHTHKQTQKERRANKEIVREIIEKEIFEQEHKGVTKENMVRGSSLDRGSTPDSVRFAIGEETGRQQLYQQQQQQQQQQYDEHGQLLVLVEDYMVPPEFIQKIQPCRAIDGDEARFECIFKGDPKPGITWYRDNKMIKPSNLYNIVTNLEECKSTLIIKRVALNGNAVYTVKADNSAGSAKSSANLVVEPHPLPTFSLGGVARKIDSMNFGQSDVYGAGGSVNSESTWASDEHLAYLNDSSQSDSLASSQQSKVIKSVRTRKLSADQMAALIRASPEGLIAPTFLHTIHDVQSKLGELARIDARLVGTQPIDIRWLKDGERVRADRSHKMVLEGDLYTLLILECSQQDEGTYECIASNRVGEARCEAKLSIVDARPPSALRGSRTPELITGGHTYSSSAVASSSMTVASSSSSMSSSQQQIQMQSSSSDQHPRSHYGIQKHQHSLVGHYTPAGTVTTTTTHQQEIPKLIKRLDNQQVMEGKSVTLRCQISSFPIAEVHWYKQGDKLIKPSKYFRIFKDNDETYCLKILETFAEDQGEYKCVARAPNGRAQVETKATITVIPNSPK